MMVMMRSWDGKGSWVVLIRQGQKGVPMVMERPSLCVCVCVCVSRWCSRTPHRTGSCSGPAWSSTDRSVTVDQGAPLIVCAGAGGYTAGRPRGGGAALRGRRCCHHSSSAPPPPLLDTKPKPRTYTPPLTAPLPPLVSRWRTPCRPPPRPLPRGPSTFSRCTGHHRACHPRRARPRHHRRTRMGAAGRRSEGSGG
jgi:hypothetical protein